MSEDSLFHSATKLPQGSSAARQSAPQPSALFKLRPRHSLSVSRALLALISFFLSRVFFSRSVLSSSSSFFRLPLLVSLFLLSSFLPSLPLALFRGQLQCKFSSFFGIFPSSSFSSSSSSLSWVHLADVFFPRDPAVQSLRALLCHGGGRKV